MRGRVLIVDDDPSMCEMLEADLRRRGLTPEWRTAADEGLAVFKDSDFDVVLTDLRLGGMDGIELCRRIAASRPDVPVIVMTAFGSMDAAIGAMRAGAYDFVNKPVDVDILALVLERAIKHRNLQEKVKILSAAVEAASRSDRLIGNSPAMRELYAQLGRIADTEASVLIAGESGTGKELVARELHAQSRRKDGPFVAVNCAALPEALLESELFGHRRGSFTDARTERKGLFLQAAGGTLLLDEVGEMPLNLQPKLLRALEERRIRPVGSDVEVPCDVRIIAATNRDLESAIDEGLFREDLFYRLNVIQLVLPPLRARGADVLLLAQHFLEQNSAQFGKPVVGISEPAAGKLLDYTWPGNVRELRNAIERAVALTRFDRLVVEDLPEKIRAYQSAHILVTGSDPAELVPMGEVERRYILHVLQAVGGNRSMAARVLGLDRKTLYRKLQQYESD